MSQISTPVADITEPKLVITRAFDAPRALVYACWTQPEHASKWFAPRNCTLIEWKGDPRPGGAWTMAMRHPEGDIYRAVGEYKEVIPDKRLALTHAWEGDDGQPEHWTLITVEFADQPSGGTLMTFTQGAFSSEDSRDRHRGGWGMCFDLLSEHLARVAP